METWNKYVAQNLKLEQQVEFDSEELKTIAGIKKLLPKYGDADDWENLHKELQLMVMKGYAGRKDRAKDSAKAVAEIVEWRTKNEVDTFLDRKLPSQEIYYKHWRTYIAGEDKYGHLIMFERVQEIDQKLHSLLKLEDMLLVRAQLIEAINMLKWRTSMRIGKRVCKHIYVMDLQGLSVRKHFTQGVRDVLKPIFTVSGDYYPDSLWTMFLVNAPMAFRVVWRAISPMVDPVTKTKIRMLGSEREHLEAMQRTGIPLSSVPEKIGGTCKVVDIADVVDEIYKNRQSKGKKNGDPKNPLEGYTEAELKASAQSSMANTTMVGAASDLADEEDEEVGKQVFEEDNVIASGYLFKRGNLNSAFKRRYFILTPYGLYYFQGKPTAEHHSVRGKIDLHLITSVEKLPDSEGRTGEFNVCVPGRVYHLQVDPNQEDEERDHRRVSVRKNSSATSGERANGSNASTKSTSALSRSFTWFNSATEGASRSSLKRQSKRRSRREGSSSQAAPSATSGYRNRESSEPSLTAVQWVRLLNQAAEDDRCNLEADTNAVAVNSKHTDYLRGGYLSKKGWFNHLWKKRYIVLTAHRLLYYTDRPDKPGCKLKGVIDLHLVKRVKPHKKKAGHFNVVTPVRVYKFKLATKPQEQAQVDAWIEAIDDAAKNERMAKEMRNKEDGAEEDDDNSSVTYGLSFLSDFSFAQLKSVLANASLTGMVDQMVSIAAEVIRVAEEHNMLSKDFSNGRNGEDRLAFVRRRVAYMFSMPHARSRARVSRGIQKKEKGEETAEA